MSAVEFVALPAIIALLAAVRLRRLLAAGRLRRFVLVVAIGAAALTAICAAAALLGSASVEAAIAGGRSAFDATVLGAAAGVAVWLVATVSIRTLSPRFRASKA